ncbi:DNRLRE domain-containing protein [Aggregicoccus sp. 17bor-14]|uniref:CBM96 family carbohydrate-binding protein n=1 Tax=Myxococcaceae TaxID=31 RepID=UPI00129CF1D5|nr:MULTISPECIES: DNRLRE domain-containing protein [Myxococcaceae]MBF5041979.1 DNRLRE domain-containing protein [Simulacricoccus sp. 17bor-14]MRI87759.1 DNRLRE domain-containing protein [Aggregicoccus sp. 17bor-14]
MQFKTWGWAVAAAVALACGGDADPDAVELGDDELLHAAPLAQAEFALGGSTTVFALADADARVESERSGRAFGAHSRLRVDGDPRVESVLHFRLSGVGRVRHATLRVYATSASTDAPYAQTVQGGWSEEHVTWKSRPRAAADAPRYAASGAVRADSWVELDVSAAVQGDGDYDFLLATDSADGASFVARDSTLEALRPQLVVQTEPADCAAGATAQRVEVSWPVEGFYVLADSPEKDFLRKPELRVDGDPVRESYLAFQVDRQGRTLTRATLRLFATEGTRLAPELFRVQAGAWTQDSRTWATRPQTELTPLATRRSISGAGAVDYDLTDTLMVAEGPLRLELGLKTDSPDGVDFVSAYSPDTGSWPTLRLEYEEPCAAQ